VQRSCCAPFCFVVGLILPNSLGKGENLGRTLDAGGFTHFGENDEPFGRKSALEHSITHGSGLNSDSGSNFAATKCVTYV